MKLTFSNTVGICMADTAPDSGSLAVAADARSGSGAGMVDWRVMVGSAVGAAAFAALVALVAVLLWRRRQRRALLAKQDEAAKRAQGTGEWQVRPNSRLSLEG